MIEDIFAENLVDEPDEIERVIEDGEELRRDSSGDGSDDENKKKEQEDKDKEKHKVRKKFGPRPVLNGERLKGPRGIATLEEFFSGVKLDGRRGREEKDLDIIMKHLELWTHRLFPRGQFDDCLKKIEKLGTKKLVMNYVKRIRLGMEDGSGTSDLIREEPASPPPAPSEDLFEQLMSSTTRPDVVAIGSNEEMSSEQRERMLRNRLIAEERRAARIKKAQELKERFKAQQVSNSQVFNREVLGIQSQSNVTQEQRLENSEIALRMDVDDNHASSSENVCSNQEVSNGNRYTDTTDIEIKSKNEIQLKKTENKTNFPSNMSEEHKNKIDKEPSLEKTENMVIDDEETMDSTQRKCQDITEENVGLNNGIQNQNKTEEMEVCEDSGSKKICLTEDHVCLRGNNVVEDKEVSVNDHLEDEREEYKILKSPKKCEEEVGYLEKENENPN